MTEYRINESIVPENVFSSLKSEINNIYNKVLAGVDQETALFTTLDCFANDNNISFDELRLLYELTASIPSSHKKQFDGYAFKWFGLTPNVAFNTPVTTSTLDGQHYQINGVTLPDTIWNSREYVENHLRSAFLATPEDIAEVGKDNNLTSDDIKYLTDRNHDDLLDAYEISLTTTQDGLPLGIGNPFLTGLDVFGINVVEMYSEDNTSRPTTSASAATSKDKALFAIRQSGLNIAGMTTEEKRDFDIARAAVLNDERAIDHIDPNLLRNPLFLCTLKGYYLAPYVYQRIVETLKDEPLVLQELTLHLPLVFAYLPEDMRASKPFVVEYLTSITLPFRDDINAVAPHIAESLRNDRDIALLTVRLDGEALRYFPRFQNDKPLVLEAMHSLGAALAWASPELKDDRDVVLASANTLDKTVGASVTLEFADSKFRSDKEVVLAVLKNSPAPHALDWDSNTPLDAVDPSLRGDRDVVREAVKLTGASLGTAGEPFFSDKEMIYEAFCATPDIYKEAIFNAYIDRFSLTKALERNPLVWQFIPEDLINNRAFVLSALRQGVPLDQVHPDHLNDPVAIRESIYSKAKPAIDTSLPVFQADPSLLEAYLRSGRELSFDRKDFLLLNRKTMLKPNDQFTTDLQVVALEQYGKQIYPELLTDDERQDREFTVAAAKSMGTDIFAIMPAEFLADKPVIDAAFEGPVSGNAFALLPDALKNAPDYAGSAVAKNGLALKHTGEGVKANRAVVINAVRENGFALTYASEELKHDVELIGLANGQLGFEYFPKPVTPAPAVSEVVAVAEPLAPSIPASPTVAKPQPKTQTKPQAKTASGAIEDDSY
ncbi:MAG: hypothetical protein ACD_62C00209G0008 [uncultured bacterium]|nr:MAG: hypothetical protein ACD_62C00209G0008 [uncultured bacterium]